MKLECDIQKTIDQASEFLLLNGSDHESVLRYTLFLEETLLTYRDAAFADFSLQCDKHGKTAVIKLTVPGKQLDPFENSMIIPKTLEGLENPPVYEYRSGKNIITYKPVMLIPRLKSLRFIWDHIGDKRSIFIWATVLNALETVIEIVLPIISAMVISALTASVLERLIYIGLVLAAVRVIRDFLVYVNQNMYATVYKAMSDSLSAAVTEKMLDIRIDSIERFGSGVFIQRLTEDMTGLTERLANFMDTSGMIVHAVGVLVGIAIIFPPLFFYELVTFGILLWLEMRRTNVLQQNERKNRMASEAYTEIIGEVVRSNREIKLYRGKQSFAESVSRRNDAVTSTCLTKQHTNNRYDVLRWSLRDIFSYIYLLIEVYFVSIGRLDITMAVVLFNYCDNLLPLINVFADVSELSKIIMLSCERLYQLMVSRDFPRESFGQTHTERLRGEISFRSVSFAYPIGTAGERGPTVLDHMDFHIRAGEYVALIGRSGCGKSTAFNLITKLYEAQRGEVCLDGVNIKRLDEESIRKNISIVTQSSGIFNMSVRDNLKLAKRDVTEEEMIAACKKACIHDDIMRMPEQYDTLVAAEGSNLSGGQRQRLAIAMCLLKDAPILLMDEATSALDNITQAAIQKNIFDLSRSRTVLVIAHRMSTVVNCDRILFMSDGRIMTEGSHEELLRTCSEYRMLYENERTAKSDPAEVVQ